MYYIIYIYIYVYISIYKYNRKSVVEIQYSNMHTRESEYCLRNITLYIYLPVKATIATRDTAKEYRIHFKYLSFQFWQRKIFIQVCFNPEKFAISAILTLTFVMPNKKQYNLQNCCVDRKNDIVTKMLSFLCSYFLPYVPRCRQSKCLLPFVPLLCGSTMDFSAWF